MNLGRLSLVQKKGWKIINCFLPDKDKTNNNELKILNNNQIVTNKDTIANLFNNYFTNVIQTMQFPPNYYELFCNGFNQYLTNSFEPFVFHHFKMEDLLKSKGIIYKSPNGLYSIPGKYLKITEENFLNILLLIFNMSLDISVFPDILKFGSILPIYKSGSHNELKNYRPITILNNIAKLFEKCLHGSISEYLDSHNFINKNQFGFRKHHSTEFCIMALLNLLSVKLDQGYYVLTIFLDFTKALDCIDKQILYDKLINKFNFSDVAAKYILSYLTNRKCFVNIDGAKSSQNVIPFGVPQGSILGPLLFLIYINDLPSFLSCNVFLYADDTTLVICSRDIPQMFIKAQSELNILQKYASANHLQLNPSKSKFILFSPHHSHLTATAPSLSLGHINIERVYHFKFLGYLINDNLSWNDQIRHIENKLNVCLAIIIKTRRLFDLNILKLIFAAIGTSHIVYNINVILNAPKIMLNKIAVKYNEICRAMLFVNRWSHISNKEIQNKIDLASCDLLFKKHNLLLINKCEKGKCPTEFYKYFENKNQRTQCINVPFGFKQSKFKSNCPQIWMINSWNILPKNIKLMTETEFIRNISKIMNNQ